MCALTNTSFESTQNKQVVMQVEKQSLHLSDSLRGRAQVRTDQDGTQHCGKEAVYRRGRRHRQHWVIVAQHHGFRWGVQLVRGVERQVCR